VYTWWVFLHLVGVFGFLAAHGVSIGVLFKLRSERDPAKIAAYLQLSGASTRVFYYSLGLLVVAGTVAGFLGHWWGQAWIWTAIAVLVVTTLAMYYMAKPYYRRVDRIAKSKAGGSEAVTDEQFDEVLKDRRPVTIAAMGIAGLLAILFLMVLKPQFGLAGSAAPPPGSASCTPNGTQRAERGVRHRLPGGAGGQGGHGGVRQQGSRDPAQLRGLHELFGGDRGGHGRHHQRAVVGDGRGEGAPGGDVLLPVRRALAADEWLVRGDVTMAYHRILVGTDGSITALLANRIAARLAGRWEADLVIVTVRRPNSARAAAARTGSSCARVSPVGRHPGRRRPRH